MEKQEYQTLYKIEDGYWWFVGLRGLIFSLIDKFRYKRDALRVLDAGCGTGGLLSRLGKYTTYGFDISEETIKFCRLRELNNIVRGSICDIPFKNNSFDFAISLDVLYHKGVKSDTKALEELWRVLDKQGVLLLNLPAYDFLRSKHDKAIHTEHRYTIKELRKKVSMAGFKIEKITYRNTILFPLIAIKRFMEKIFSKNEVKSKSDLRALPDLINKLFAQILFLENRLITGLDLPFGLSIFCIARKE